MLKKHVPQATIINKLNSWINKVQSKMGFTPVYDIEYDGKKRVVLRYYTGLSKLIENYDTIGYNPMGLGDEFFDLTEGTGWTLKKVKPGRVDFIG